MAENKRCPLKFTALKHAVITYPCDKEKCAWWIKEFNAEDDCVFCRALRELVELTSRIIQISKED